MTSAVCPRWGPRQGQGWGRHFGWQNAIFDHEKWLNMWISLENRLVELWFHKKNIGEISWENNGQQWIWMGCITYLIWYIALPENEPRRWWPFDDQKCGWNGPKFEIEPLSAKDYSKVTKGMRLQAEADGKYWAAEVPGIPRGHVGEYPLLPSWWVWSVISDLSGILRIWMPDDARSKLDITWSRNSLIMFGACFPGPVWLRMPRSWQFQRKTRPRRWPTSQAWACLSWTLPRLGHPKSRRSLAYLAGYMSVNIKRHRSKPNLLHPRNFADEILVEPMVKRPPVKPGNGFWQKSEKSICSEWRQRDRGMI